MKRHLKRQVAPKNWPIPRKGTTFIVKNNSKGIPILVVLRDMMKIAQNRKEVKKAIHKRDLVVLGKPINDEKKSMELYDVLTIVPTKKNYRLVLSEKGKFAIEEIDEKESKEKIAKVIGKKTLKGKKNQINLSDGRNYIAQVKCKVGDSVLVDIEKKKISKVLPIKEKSEVLVTWGKHAGTKGTIAKIDEKQQMVEIHSKEKKFRALIKQIMVLN